MTGDLPQVKDFYFKNHEGNYNMRYTPYIYFAESLTFENHVNAL